MTKRRYQWGIIVFYFVFGSDFELPWEQDEWPSTSSSSGEDNRHQKHRRVKRKWPPKHLNLTPIPTSILFSSGVRKRRKDKGILSRSSAGEKRSPDCKRKNWERHLGLEEEERLLQKQNTHKKNQKIGSSQKPQNLFMEKENCTSERKEKKKIFLFCQNDR